jgi:preprotein translocase subunit SecF
MFVVRHRHIFFILTALIVIAALGSIVIFGLNFGTDFTGGALTEVSYPEGRPDRALLVERIGSLELGGFSLRQTGEMGYILRTKDLTELERQSVIEALSLSGDAMLVQERFASIGPVLGVELRNKALASLVVVIISMILFVAYVFRKVSKPVSSWKYGVIAIIALTHDILIPVGMFSILGYVFGAEIDVLFVVALLTILGYSLNDTIVVFDRIRENLKENQELNRTEDFELTVGKSLNQTYTRSINTSFTTVLVLLALFFIGGVATRDFALVLITGMVAGTYSSIFLATPLLVTWERFTRSRS